jgi:His/Glu/Gln/Arg/opine family amino acid ABC transporter permease subunit
VAHRSPSPTDHSRPGPLGAARHLRAGSPRLQALLGLILMGVIAVVYGGMPVAHAEPKDKYVIGTDTTFAPFEFKDSDGNLAGIDMDLIQAIAKDQGFEVEIKPLGFDAAVQALQSDQVDGVIAGMSITDERKQTFDFTDKYFTGGVQMAVPEGSDVEGYDDLQGETVAVKTGTTGKEFADENADKYGYKTQTYEQTTDMVEAVKAGQAVGYFEDYPVLAYGISTGSGFKMVGDQQLKGDYAMAVNKGQNPELVEKFNAGLKNLKDSGEYDKIMDQYLGADGDGSNPEGKAAGPQNVGDLVSQYWPVLVKGVGLTLLTMALAFAVAFVIGVVCGFARIAKFAPFRWISTAYLYVFRGTPLLIQAFFMFFAVPQIIQGLGWTDFRLSPFVAGGMALTLNTGAYMTEIVRGGIQAVDPGQTEASRSLGLSNRKTMRKIVLPQAFRIMIPSFVNQGIITLKDTSLLSAIGFGELTYQSRQIISTTYMSSQVLLIAAAMYFIVITILTWLSHRFERKYSA